MLGTEETLYSCWLVFPRLGIVSVILWLYLLSKIGEFKTRELSTIQKYFINTATSSTNASEDIM